MYHKFSKQITDDEDRYIQLTAPAPAPAKPTAPSTDAQATELMQQAMADLRNGQTNAARDALTQLERLNPKQRGLWLSWASLYGTTGEFQNAEDAMQKANTLHPDWAPPYQMLAMYYKTYRHDDDLAIETLRNGLRKLPGDPGMLSYLTRLLMADKKYKDVIDLLRAPAEKNPKNQQIQMEFTEALVRGGNKEEGLAAAQKLVKDFPNALAFNNAGYALADTSIDLPLALQYAQKAVSLEEDAMKQVTLASLNDQDLGGVRLLAAYWDTLGWAYFKSGDSENAKKYLKAAWLLSQRGDVADHLARLYAKQGMRPKAVHLWELALAADSRLADVRDRLRKLGIATGPSPAESLRRVKGHKPAVQWRSPAGPALSQLRTTKIPGIPKQEGTAEYFLLFSATKVADAQFISGSEKLKSVTAALLKAHYNMPLPDSGPEKIARRGVLSCSTYSSPSCEFVFLLPSTTRK